MKFMTAAMVAAGALAAAGALGAPIAIAEPGDALATHPIGTQGTVADGPSLQGWTVSELRPSSDAIDYQPHGTLWEAAATDEALQGSVIPIVANFSARSAGGQDYPALFSVPTPHGVSPGILGQGEKTSGKVYFDVTGDAPNSVVYQNGGQELLRWEQAAPRPQGPAGGSGASAPPAPRAPTPAVAPRPAPATPHAPQAPAASSPKTPAAGGSAGTPLPTETP